LKYLKNLHNLNSLYISNTDINKGVDHLPVNLSRIYFSVRERPESKVGEIARQLNSFLSEKAREVEKKSSQNLTDKEFKKAQEYLDKEYPLSKRKEKT